MIVLDIEWNRGYDKKPLDEILQIGAVRLDHFGGPVTDTFNVFIRPCVHKKFSPGARELPELKASKTSQVTFAEGWAAFLEWCGDETEFAAWGGDDFLALKKNTDYWKQPELVLPKTYDLQRAFGYMVGCTTQQIALHRAVLYCQIPETFTFHNALNDAMYTALLSSFVTEEALAWRPAPGIAKGRRRFTTLPYPDQPKCKVGPFHSLEELLNDKTARKPLCPICQKPLSIHLWQGVSATQYYSAAACPEHGRFPCRLTAAQMEDGTWKAKRTIPQLSPEVMGEYQRSLKGKIFRCKAAKKKKKKRWYGQRKKAAAS